MVSPHRQYTISHVAGLLATLEEAECAQLAFGYGRIAGMEAHLMLRGVTGEGTVSRCADLITDPTLREEAARFRELCAYKGHSLPYSFTHRVFKRAFLTGFSMACEAHGCLQGSGYSV